MKNEFVTYEITVKLKELGFDEPCFGYYTPMKPWMIEPTNINFTIHFHGPNWANSDNTMYFMYLQNSFGDRSCTIKNSEFTKAIYNIAVPLWQQVIDWLREEHDLEIELPKYNLKYLPHIYKNLTCIWQGDYTDYIIARKQAILKAIELCQKK